MKKYLLLAMIVGCLSAPVVSLGTTNLLDNGSFEKTSAWICRNCTDGDTAADLFQTFPTPIAGDQIAVWLNSTASIYQAVQLPTSTKRPLRLQFSYATDASLTVAVRNQVTNKRYAHLTVTAADDPDGDWKTEVLTLPKEAAGKTVRVILTSTSGTTAVDQVVLYQAAYPLARVTVYDAQTRQVIPEASVFFRTKTSKQRVTLERQSSGVESTAVTTGALGKTPIVIVKGKPKKLQLCAQSGEARRCTSAYDANYFAWDKSGDFSFYL